MTTTIEPRRPIATFINVFTVPPENQQALVDYLIRMTEETMSKVPGYISANFHRSLDGRHVTNYAQWESKEAFDAMLARPDVQAHFREMPGIGATVEGYLYEVVYSDGKG